MMDEKPVDSNKVEIFGRHYSIGGTYDSEYLKKLAQMVDDRMRRIAESTGTVDTLKVAILAAMYFADSHFKAYQKQQKADDELERNLTALKEQIDIVLSP